MLDSDGTGNSTQVHVVWCVWVPVVMSYPAKHLIALFPRDRALVLLAWYWQPQGMASVALDTHRAGLHRGSIVGRQVVKSCLSVAIVMGERTGIDHSRVWFFLGWCILLFW
jgi:hypothetical protein